MLLNSVLDAITLPKAETMFKLPPKGTYLVWMDSLSRRGADTVNCLSEHAISLEVYAYKIDRAAEKQVEDVLDSFAIHFERQERQWLQTEQLFLTIYDFSYTEKEW
jgi:hypothetical protein